MTPTTTARAATIRPTTPVASRPSYRTAIAVGACVLALYVLTLAPTTSMWDTSEFITAASTLGLPHPPGNPLFVLIGHVFAMLPIAPSVAARVNLISAISSAAAAAIWFLITERILTSWFASAAQRRLGGIVAALLSATAFTVWNQSLVVEHVYDIVLLGCAVIAWLTFQWLDRPDGRAADRRLVLIAYLLGLGYTNHMAGMLAAPAVAAAVLIRRPRTLLRWKLLAVCAGVIALSMTVFVTQPIRSAQFPPINEGEPTACRTGFAWSCTFSKGTYDVFMYNFNRGQYGKGPLTVRQAPFTAQLGMWWYYFKWQWMRDPFGQHPATQSVLAALFFVLGLFGGWVHFSRDRRTFWFFGAFLFTASLLLIYYLNFKYGNTQPSDSANVDREVRDRDYFYIWGFSAWGVWATLGLLYVWEAVASFFGTKKAKSETAQ